MLQAALGVLAVTSVALSQVALSVYINELNYDDQGQDAGEGIKVAGPTGTDLSGWRLGHLSQQSFRFSTDNIWTKAQKLGR